MSTAGDKDVDGWTELDDSGARVALDVPDGVIIETTVSSPGAIAVSICFVPNVSVRLLLTAQGVSP